MSSDASNPSEQRIERARQGDRRAVEELLEPHLPRLIHFLERRLPSLLSGKESAVDIVQSTCREILGDLPRFESHGEGEGAFRKWLFATSLRKLRDRERYHRRLKRDVVREVRHHGDPWDRLYRTTTTPSRQAVSAEQRERLQAAVGRLSGPHRQLIQMVYFEGCRIPEVARRLRKKPTALHSQLARALARLARVMGEQGGQRAPRN